MNAVIFAYFSHHWIPLPITQQNSINSHKNEWIQTLIIYLWRNEILHFVQILCSGSFRLFPSFFFTILVVSPQRSQDGWLTSWSQLQISPHTQIQSNKIVMDTWHGLLSLCFSSRKQTLFQKTQEEFSSVFLDGYGSHSPTPPHAKVSRKENTWPRGVEVSLLT